MSQCADKTGNAELAAHATRRLVAHAICEIVFLRYLQTNILVQYGIVEGEAVLYLY